MEKSERLNTLFFPYLDAVLVHFYFVFLCIIIIILILVSYLV